VFIIICHQNMTCKLFLHSSMLLEVFVRIVMYNYHFPIDIVLLINISNLWISSLNFTIVD